MTTATPKIVIGEHTITIEQNGQQAPLHPGEFENLTNPLPDSPADEYFTGGAIKAVGEQGEVGGYLIVWGSPAQRDLQGEYFTPETEMRLDYYKERPVLYHHGLGDSGSLKIGEIYDITKDDKGVYARARLFLNDANSEVRAVATGAWELTKQDKLFWSSGSLGHLVKTDPDGRITKWPLVEGSLTPTPAEPQRTKVDAIKTAIQQLVTDTETAPIEPAAKEDSDDVPIPADRKHKARPKLKTRKRGTKMLTMEQIEALREKGLDDSAIVNVMGVLAEGASAEPVGLMAEDEEPLPEEEDEEFPVRSEDVNLVKPSAKATGLAPEMVVLQGQVKTLQGTIRKMKTAPPSDNATPAGRSATKNNTTIRVTSKWDHMEWEDMIFVKTILDGAHKYRGEGRWRPEDPEGYMRALAAKAEKSDRTFSELAIKTVQAIKADELNYSTQASFGDEFVPDLWRSQLWEKPRIDNPVFREMQVIEMPSDPYNIPVEDADPTIFTVAETTDEDQLGQNDSNAAIPDTKVGTANTTLAAGKLAARINISAELVEDSIIPVAQHWRFKSVRAMEDARDFVILSADATTGSSNINNSGGSIGATNKALYGGGDGLLHLPLVTTVASTVDMGNAKPTLAKIREARTKLNNEIVADFGNLVYFCDPLTSVALAGMDEFVDASINGRDSTVNTGFIGQIDGIDVFVSNQMSLALATGFQSSTAGLNTRGRLLLAHKPSWYVGFRRNISANLAFQPHYDAWVLVVSMRMALARRAADVATVLVNISV